MKTIEMTKTFVIAIVLYKELILEASTVKTLMEIAEDLNNYGVKIYIWDNSPIEQKIEDLSIVKNLFESFEYQHTPENISLAKIYNSIYKQNLEYKFLVLFDQDSEISISYFTELVLEIENNPEINLFLPIIRTRELIASPANRLFVTGRYWKYAISGITSSKNRLAITSGMAIAMRYLKQFKAKFNEELLLYGIDTDFMIQYEKTNTNFFVMKYEMIHDLSYFNEEDIDKRLFRFLNHKDSILKIYKKESIKLQIISFLFIFASSLKMAIKNRDKRFLIDK